MAGGRRSDGGLTSVVDVGGNLDVALLRVDGDVVEVLVLLQGEISPQLQAVPVLVRRVDQHGVVVVKLKVGGGGQVDQSAQIGSYQDVGDIPFWAPKN